MKVGRIDALAAGPSGVPTPFTSLEDSLARFSEAGFNNTQTIGLVYDSLQMLLFVRNIDFC